MTEIVPSIFRLTIPFEDVYTTVFIIRTPRGAVLFDTATYESDVDRYIYPALTELGVSYSDLRFIVLSHSHRDHAGGVSRLMELYPDTCIVSLNESLLKSLDPHPVLLPEAEEMLLGCLSVLPLPGHASDCLGLYDVRSQTLLTGDSLQSGGLYGNGKWGANITMIREHLQALDRLRTLDIAALIASHDYHPCGYAAFGRAEILRYIDSCESALRLIRGFLNECPDLDDETAADLYNDRTGLPSLGAQVVRAVRNAACKGIL